MGVRVMELISVLVCCLVIFSSCNGFKISGKLDLGESSTVSDMSSHKINATADFGGAESKVSKGVQTRSFEAKIPFLVSKKKEGYEIKIPLTVDEGKAPETQSKIALFSGLQLFERRSSQTTDKTTEKSTKASVPVIKGSLFNVKPGFLIPIPYPFNPSHKAPDHRENEIEGLSPPTPQRPWILNTTPFPGILVNATDRPFPHEANANPNEGNRPSVWDVLENNVWGPRDPIYWNQVHKNHWISQNQGGFGSNHHGGYPNYYTQNVGYPNPQTNRWNTYYQKPVDRPVPKGRWISCPPFEVNQDRATARQVYPGCPQYKYTMPPDVETVNVTPVSVIDDKTFFKDLTKMTEIKPEEPKVIYS